MNKKVDDIIKDLKNIREEYGNIDLIYASDSEWNRFDFVYYSPSIGNFNGCDFTQKNNDTVFAINACCIN